MDPHLSAISLSPLAGSAVDPERGISIVILIAKMNIIIIIKKLTIIIISIVSIVILMNNH